MDTKSLNYNHLISKTDPETINFVRCYIHYGLTWSTAGDNGGYWSDVCFQLYFIMKNPKSVKVPLTRPPLVKLLSPSNQVLITTAVALSLAFPWQEFPAPENTSWEEVHAKLIKCGTLFENMDYNPRNDQLRWWSILPSNSSLDSNRFFTD
jgi:hypothetical protein